MESGYTLLQLFWFCMRRRRTRELSELVSVIMSVYNEPISVLETSVQSIINQTYKRIQFVIINDNPEREDLDLYLQNISHKYEFVDYIVNEENMGLVKSLNKGIKLSKGKYIARMDADDISALDRVEKQYYYLINNDCDMIGAWITKIDEDGNIIGKINVPETHEDIVKYQKYGSCILHPTWFLKKEVYDALNGYRNIFACEDYDFIARALDFGFKVGNIPESLLQYRIRSGGVSVSSEAQQRLTMYYIRRNADNIRKLSIDVLNEYFRSDEYKKEFERINSYIQDRNNYRNTNLRLKKFFWLMRMLVNKYFYISVQSKYVEKIRCRI